MADGVNGTQQTALEHKRSVKIDDFIKEEGGVLNLFVPSFGYTNYGSQLYYQSLPDILPVHSKFNFFQNRDIISLITPQYDPLWSSVISTAVTKGAAWGWEVSSSVPLRRKRAYEIMQYSTAGSLVGWVKFIAAHLRSYLLTGKAFVEIERDTMGRVVALHHLNPLRCLMTDSPETPVLYYDKRGRIHELKYWEVMVLGDQIDATEGEIATVEGAAERAYTNIKIMSAMYRYFYEKVTGKRALSLEFIQGINSQSLKDAFASAEHEQERKGAWVYKGVVTIPIPQSDTPITRISIPIAEVPDGFDFQMMRDDAVITYAAATGQDLNDIDPRLASARNLGSGAQSVVLMEKASGKGLAAWREQFTADIHALVLQDSVTQFAFIEDDLRDREQEARINQTNAGTLGTLIDKQIILPLEARNLAVDNKLLPREFIQEDMTAGDTISSDEPADKGEVEDRPPVVMDETVKEVKDRVDELISLELVNARDLVKKVRENNNE